MQNISEVVIIIMTTIHQHHTHSNTHQYIPTAIYSFFNSLPIILKAPSFTYQENKNMHGEYHISSMLMMLMMIMVVMNEKSDDFIDHANTDYVLLYDHITHHGVLCLIQTALS
jgi:hypothetical protein